MSKGYSWQETTDEAVAAQMVLIGVNLTQEPFSSMFSIGTNIYMPWRAHAAMLQWLQSVALPQADAFKQAYVGARDRLTHGPDKNPFTLPATPTFTPPAGGALMDDFFEWANDLVRVWKTNKAFTPDLQRQMGLRVPSATPVAPDAVMRGVKTMSGGLVTVDVSHPGAAMAIVQLNVDGAAWPVVAEGGRYQKTLSGSRFEFQVPGGSAHSVALRVAPAGRDGAMLGDWSEVKTVSTLA